MSEDSQKKDRENLSGDFITQELEKLTNPKETLGKSHVRTFARDVAEQMKTDSGSVVKIALAEQGRQREYETIVKKSKKQQIITLIFIFVFFVGGAIILGLTVRHKNSTVAVSETAQGKLGSIVFAESQAVVDTTNLSRAEFLNTFLQKVSFIKAAGITNVVMVKSQNSNPNILSASEVLNLIALNIPEGLPQSLSSEFMVGVDGDNNFATFIIISFENFDKVVQLMREWEPFLMDDFVRFFDIKTDSIESSIFAKTFDSEILFNKESRVLRDKNQGFVMGYSFLDRNHLVITTNLKTIQEVLDRYTVQSIK